MITLNIIPIGKPRMTGGDRANYRKPVIDYWEYKRELNKLVNETDFKIGNELNNIIFVPKSYSVKKRLELEGKPHLLRPDLDNLLKAFQDSLLDNDSCIHTYRNISKVWGNEGKIIIE